MRNDQEHNEQCAVIRWCELNKSKYPALEMIYAITNFHITTPRRGAYLKAEGRKKAMPDLCLPVPTSSLPKTYKLYGSLYIEMKSGKNKPTKEQLEKHEQLRGWGNKVVVCYSWTEAVNEICDYLGIPKKV